MARRKTRGTSGNSSGAAAAATSSGVEALLLPTAPERAFVHGAPVPDGQADLTSLASAAGLPALAFPIPSAAAGPPASAQLIGRPFSDGRLIALAARLTGGVDAS